MAPIATLVLLWLLGMQRTPSPRSEEKAADIQLPSGKSQRREILKADFEKSKTDAAELAELAAELKEDLEKKDYQILDLRTMKKAEEIEKLARRIKDRMKRHM